MPGGFRSLIEDVGRRAATPFRVQFPDGSEYRNVDGPPAFSLSFGNERALRRAGLYGHVECAIRRIHAGHLAIASVLATAAAFSPGAGCWQAHSPSAAAMKRTLAKCTDFMDVIQPAGA